jgi:hypothetical protein
MRVPRWMKMPYIMGAMKETARPVVA